MKLIKTIIVAALFGMSFSAFAAVSDLTYQTHGPQYEGQDQEFGTVTERRFADYGQGPKIKVEKIKPVTESFGNSRFSDLSAVTHDIIPVPPI